MKAFVLIVLTGALTSCTIFGGSKQKAVLPEGGDQTWHYQANTITHFDQTGKPIATEKIVVENADMSQPEAPSEGATFSRKTEEGNTVKMSTGAANEPLILETGVNPLLLWGGGLLVLGIILTFVGKHPLLAFLPKGLNWGLCAGGIVLMALTTLLENILLALLIGAGAIIAVAYFGAGIDNWKKIKLINGTSHPKPSNGTSEE
tara:strand:- start:4031 stop:4642 length:612 start_codon:yes stop_codon:yes gene_type:complete